MHGPSDWFRRWWDGTPQLPWHQFGRLLRLWGMVLAGNLVGVTIFALGMLKLQQFDAATQAAFVDTGRELMHNTPFEMFSKGVLAGWIIAMMAGNVVGGSLNFALISHAQVRSEGHQVLTQRKNMLGQFFPESLFPYSNVAWTQFVVVRMILFLL